VGEVVTVTFNPGLKGTRIGKLLKVMLPNGKELLA
jgi:ribosomal protein L35AE/L33A